jgi:hypothetical protein
LAPKKEKTEEFHIWRVSTSFLGGLRWYKFFLHILS